MQQRTWKTPSKLVSLDTQGLCSNWSPTSVDFCASELAAAFVEGLEPWTADPQITSPCQKPGKHERPWSFQAPCWQAGSWDAGNTSKYALETPNSFISWLPRKPRRANFALPSPMAILSPNMQSLARCLQANQTSIKNQWTSNWSWRKKLAQNQMFSWNVCSIALSKIFHQLLFQSPCPSHGLWQQLRKSISDQPAQCSFSLHLTMHSPFAQVSWQGTELTFRSQHPFFPDS